MTSKAEELALVQAELGIAFNLLWERGEIREILLDADQLEDSAKFRAKQDDFVALWSRRRGKSFWATVECLAQALSKPNQLIKYAAKTQLSVMDIVEPNMRLALETCPEHLRPSFDGQAKKWTFKNGSEIKAAGVDGDNYERLRGTGAHLVVKDESAFWTHYEEADAVLSPQLLTTRGVTLEISTPPESMAHPFTSRYHAALARGRSTTRPIWNCPRMQPGEIEHFLEKEAGKRGQSYDDFLKSTYFRREYLCEFVTEESRAAVPGWNMERQKALVREVPRPKHYDGYTSFDVGFGDPHFVLFGWLDFKARSIVIEDEIHVRQAVTDVIADAIKVKETALFGVDRFDGTLLGAVGFVGLPDWLSEAAKDTAPRQPYFRVIDAPQVVVADLWRRHGLAFVPTRKDDKAAAMDEVDSLIRQGRIIIHPRCIKLIQSLYSTVWNKNRTGWERAEDGHGDGVDALSYMARNIAWNRNPEPKPQPLTVHPFFEDAKRLQSKPRNEAFASAMGLRKLR